MESVDNISKIEYEPPQFDAVKFTIKSFIWVFVVFVLLAASFLNFFNYPAIKFYSSLNLKARALESAEAYLNGGFKKDKTDDLPVYNSKYADALLCAVNNSISIMNLKSADDFSGKSAQRYAKKVDKHVALYLSYNTKGSMGTRSELIDSYNLSHTIPQMHPSLFSFSDFLAVKQAKARLILGEDFLFLQDCNSVTQDWANNDWALDSSNTKDILNSQFVMFDKLNQYLSRELNQLGFYSLPKSPSGEVDFNSVKDNIILKGNNFSLLINSYGAFTDLYQKINMRFDDFKDYIRQNAIQLTTNEQLKVTYYLRIMTEFAQNMQYFSLVVGANKAKFSIENQNVLQNLYKDVWLEHAIVADAQIYEGGKRVTKKVSMNKWYSSGLLIDYLALYAQGETNG